MSTRATVITAVVLAALGAVIGGIVGAVVALAGVLSGDRFGARSVAGVAVVLLVVAALFTAFEAPATAEPADYLFDFALDRPIAAELGRIAGVLTLVAIVLAAIREREPA